MLIKVTVLAMDNRSVTALMLLDFRLCQSQTIVSYSIMKSHGFSNIVNK